MNSKIASNRSSFIFFLQKDQWHKSIPHNCFFRSGRYSRTWSISPAGPGRGSISGSFTKFLITLIKNSDHDIISALSIFFSMQDIKQVRKHFRPVSVGASARWIIIYRHYYSLPHPYSCSICGLKLVWLSVDQSLLTHPLRSN